MLVSGLNFQAFSGQELCESNQQILNFNTISETKISAYSPLRVGDVGTGQEDLVAITSQYNQPRKESGILRVHAGLDLRTRKTDGTGRDVFSVFNGGRVIHTTDNGGGYGKYVVIQHEYIPSGTGKRYYFQSLYAHLDSRALTSTTSRYYNLPYTTKVGKSGYSGMSDSSQIHLHLEFLTPKQEVNNNIAVGNFRYAPSVFYWHKGAWGTNTSFINYSNTTENTVIFNIVSYDNGAAHSVAADKVKIYYKNASSSGGFTSKTMSKNGHTFVSTFTGFPVGTTIQYYIEAQENRWDGTYYKAFRPYYDRLSTPPPADKCFKHVMVTSTVEPSSIIEEYLQQASSTMSYQEFIEDKTYDGRYEPQINIPWIPSEESVRKGLELNNISFLAKVIEINNDGSLVVESINGGEMFEMDEYQTAHITEDLEKGQIYTVNLEFEDKIYIGNVYRLKGLYDNETETITVYDSLFFSGYYEETN